MYTNRLTFILFLLISFAQTKAQTTFTSTGNGNWTAAFNSSGSGSMVKYIIQTGDTITINTANTQPIDTVIVYGVLQFVNGKKIDLNDTGVVILASGGSVSGGNGGSGFRFGAGIATTGAFNNNGVAYTDGSTASFINGNVLPVSWLDYSGQRFGGSINLNWSTATETNNAYFTIELGPNPAKLDSVAVVKSQASTGNSLEKLDYSVQLRLTNAMSSSPDIYTRITQVDYDGKKSSSELIVLRQTQKNLASISSGFGFIQVSHDHIVDAEISIYNMRGQSVKVIGLVGKQTIVPIGKAGFYVVKVQSNGTIFTQKVYVRLRN